MKYEIGEMIYLGICFTQLRIEHEGEGKEGSIVSPRASMVGNVEDILLKGLRDIGKVSKKGLVFYYQQSIIKTDVFKTDHTGIQQKGNTPDNQKRHFFTLKEPGSFCVLFFSFAAHTFLNQKLIIFTSNLPNFYVGCKGEDFVKGIRNVFSSCVT